MGRRPKRIHRLGNGLLTPPLGLLELLQLLELLIKRLLNLDEALLPVGQVSSVKLGSQPIEKGVGSGNVSLCVGNAESTMGKGQDGGVRFRGKFVADYTFFDQGLVPLMLEDMRWIPHQNAAGDGPLFPRNRRTLGNHFDSAAWPAIDHGGAKPVAALFGVGNRRPDFLNRVS